VLVQRNFSLTARSRFLSNEVKMSKTDHTAIAAVLSGDKDAYADLVRAHGRSVFRVARRITGNEADAEDVAQETFLRGYRTLESFQSRANFGTWIYRIAVRCALDKLCSRRPEQEAHALEASDGEPEFVQVVDQAPGPEQLVLSGEIAAFREAAMASLTPLERAAFMLRHMEACSSEEIATALDVAPDAAKQAIYRAVQKMRKRLAFLKVRV
jgi:RNA polymerase sigma-70 factor (ECF subfamily)